MANPLKNEKELYDKIKRENITVHPIVWELINHHVRNDLNWISMCMGLYRLTPSWILHGASLFMKLLYKISRQFGDPPADLLKTFEGTINRVKLIDSFLKRLQEKTSRK